MKPVQYIIANQGANMSPGKLAAQVAHASVKGYIESRNDILRDAWWATGHTKIVLAARDTAHLGCAAVYLRDHGIQCWMIIDEGRTEVDPLTPTALGFPILDYDDEKVQFAFSTFEPYKEPRPAAVGLPPEGFALHEITPRRRWWRRDR